MSVRTPLRLLIGLLVVSFLWPLWVKAEESSLTDLQALRYIASYGDLIDAFGADAEKGRAHYTAWGIKEGRTITFDPLRYAASHPDLIEAFGSDEAKATVHYIQYGYREQRQTTFSDLDAWSYIASYADLIAAFATDATAGIRHYLNFGYREGRQILFDALAYIASYSDLIGAFGTDAVAGVKHYITWGYQEGRQILFDAVAYLARYADLRAVFGSNTAAATQHYIQWGFQEGRDGSKTPPVAKISIVPADIVIRSGESLQLVVTLSSADGRPIPDQPINWSISNPQVINVNSSNVLTAASYDGFDVRSGTITANVGDVSVSSEVKVITSSSFAGYRVDPSAKRLGIEYWENTPVPLDLILRVFLTRHKNYSDDIRFRNQFSGWSGSVTAGDFNADGFIDVFTAGSACNGMQSRPTFLLWNPSTWEFDEKNLFNDGTNYIVVPEQLI